MTLLTTESYTLFFGDGLRTEFVATFPLFDERSLFVLVDNVILPSTVYTVSGDINEPGWSVTLMEAPEFEKIVRLQRVSNAQQLTEFQPYGQYKAEQHEMDFDKSMLLLQEVRGVVGQFIRDGLPGSPEIPPGEGPVIDFQFRLGINSGDADVTRDGDVVNVKTANLIAETYAFDPTADAVVTGNWDFLGALLKDGAEVYHPGNLPPPDFDPALDYTVTGDWDFLGALQKDGGDVWHVGNLPQPTSADQSETISGQWEFLTELRAPRLSLFRDTDDTYQPVARMVGGAYEAGLDAPGENFLINNWQVRESLDLHKNLRLNDDEAGEGGGNWLNGIGWDATNKIVVGDLAEELTFVDTLTPRHWDGTSLEFMLSTQFYDPREVQLISNDPEMISIQQPNSIDDTTLLIQVNQPLGIPKLTAGGKISTEQLPVADLDFFGVWDASANTLPPTPAFTGVVYVIVQPGTLQLTDPNTGIVSPVDVVAGDYIIWGYEFDTSLPSDGWYHIIREVPAVLEASNVLYDNSGSGWDSGTVQEALDEIWLESVNRFPVDYTSRSPIDVPVILRAAPGQTAALQQWYNESGQWAEVQNDGRIKALDRFIVQSFNQTHVGELAIANNGELSLSNLSDGNALALRATTGNETRDVARWSGGLGNTNLFTRTLKVDANAHFADQSAFISALAVNGGIRSLARNTGVLALVRTTPDDNAINDILTYQLDHRIELTNEPDGVLALFSAANVQFPSPFLRIDGGNGAVEMDGNSLLLKVAGQLQAQFNLNGASVLQHADTVALQTQADGIRIRSAGSVIKASLWATSDLWYVQTDPTDVRLVNDQNLPTLIRQRDEAGLYTAMQIIPGDMIELRHRADLALRTADRSAGTNSGAAVRAQEGSWQPVGYNTLPVKNVSAPRALDTTDIGWRVRVNQAGVNVTVDAGVFSAGDTIVLVNGVDSSSTWVSTLIQGAGMTLRWYSGDGIIDNTNLELAPGAAVTLHFFSDSVCEVWGGGISTPS